MVEEAAQGTRIRDVEQMPVYQAFFQLALDIEKTTREMGYDFGWLRVQCLKSSESVCANMTEGFYSQYSTEYIQSLYRCRREARETVGHIRYAQGAGRINRDAAQALISRYEDALLQLANLIASIERKARERGKAKDMPCAVSDLVMEYCADTPESTETSGIISRQPSTISHSEECHA